MTTTAALAGLRWFVVRDLPLLVVEAFDEALPRRVDLAGMPRLQGFLGQQLPHGVRLGITVSADEFRLADEAGEGLLRTDRAAVDGAWLESAKRRRGTMLLVVDHLDLPEDAGPAEVVAAVEARATNGALRGGLVGVEVERPVLPLLGF